MKRGETKQAAARLDTLPTIPSLAISLLETAFNSTTRAVDLLRIIEVDPGVTARLLRLANASVRGSASRVATIADASAIVGAEVLRSVALSVDIRLTSEPGRDGELCFDHIKLWKHSLTCAIGCKLIAARAGADPEEAFVAGLLHDMGKLVLDRSLCDDYRLVLEEAAAKRCSVMGAEHAVLGADHALVGKWTAERWMFPDPLTRAIWLHHHPYDSLRDMGPGSELAGIVQLANFLSHVGVGRSGDGTPEHRMPVGLVEAIGLTDEDVADIRRELASDIEQRLSAFDLEAVDPERYSELCRRANAELSAKYLERAEHNSSLAAEADRLRKIQEVHARLGACKSLPEVSEVIAEILQEELGVKCGLCYILDDENGVVHELTWMGEDGATNGDMATGQTEHEPAKMWPAEPDGGFIGPVEQAALRRQASPTVGEGQGRIRNEDNLIVVPLVTQSGTVGRIMVDSASVRDGLSEEDVAMLHDLADATGRTISRLNLEERLTALSEEMAVALWRKEQTQEGVIQEEKYESVRSLAGGAAHEINNPLAVIFARTQMLLQEERNKEKAETLHLIAEQCRRISGVLTDLMSIARPVHPKLEPTEINDIIRRATATAEDRLSSQDITCEKRLGASLPAVMADPRQLERVFTNLILNAEHAMNNGGGTITVTSAVSDDGTRVVLRFADTGTGIPTENLRKVFDPFFTTKDEGEGRGLGLAGCQAIVKNHGGIIEVESEPGKGTTVTLAFPAATGTEEEQDRVSGRQPEADGP